MAKYEIIYERLFNLQEYNNEKIGIKKEITTDDDIKAEMREIYIQVLGFHYAFELHRIILQKMMWTKNKITSHREDVEHLATNITELQAEYNKLAALIVGKTGHEIDPDISLQYSRVKKQLDDRIQRLKNIQEKITELETVFNTWRSLLERIEKLIIKHNPQLFYNIAKEDSEIFYTVQSDEKLQEKLKEILNNLRVE